MIYHAAARGIEIEQVESSLSGDLDLRGFLGLDPTVRSGYQTIQIKLRIKANVTEKELQELGSLGPTFSPVYDYVFRGVPISFRLSAHPDTKPPAPEERFDFTNEEARKEF